MSYTAMFLRPPYIRSLPIEGRPCCYYRIISSPNTFSRLSISSSVNEIYSPVSWSGLQNRTSPTIMSPGKNIFGSKPISLPSSLQIRSISIPIGRNDTRSIHPPTIFCFASRVLSISAT